MPATVSIALCTFNGARWLGAQLESLAAQSRRPEEVVVRDDASTDGTVQVLEGFAARAPFPVRVQVNEANLGYVANFTQAIRACRGDLIFLCDQDDVWHPEKVARTVEAMATPEVGFAFTDGEVVDGELKPTGQRLWETFGFGPAEQARLARGEGTESLLHHNRVTGMTLAFRAEFRELLLPIPPGWVHDAWIALVLSAVTQGRPVAEALVQYRRHAAQSVGTGGRHSRWEQVRLARRVGARYYREQAEKHEALLERLRGVEGMSVKPEAVRVIAEKAAHLRARYELREPRRWVGGRLPTIWREWRAGRYARFASGWKSVVQDMLG